MTTGKTPRLAVVIISNPVAGRQKSARIKSLIASIAQHGGHVVFRETQVAGDGERLARETLKDEPDVIVACGGDGTINDVVNGMAYSDVPLAILPFGTSNILARELGLHKNRERAVATLFDGRRETVPLGRAGDRYFVSMAGIGFDGTVVHGVSGRLKAMIRELAYVWAGLKLFLRLRLPYLRLSVDGEEVAGRSVIIGKVRYYGGSFRVTPDARLENPIFQVCIFQGGRRRDLLRYVWGILTGRHATFPDIVLRTARHVHVSSHGASACIQLDGDYAGTAPLSFSIADNALTILRPGDSADSVPRS